MSEKDSGKSEAEELRVKVTELCGWKLYSELRGDYTLQYAYKKGEREPWKATQNWERPENLARYQELEWSEYKSGSFAGKLPDWLNDLNACAGFETIVLANGRAKQYADNLAAIITSDSFTQDVLASDFDLLHASAKQRCLAFVKTMEETK